MSIKIILIQYILEALSKLRFRKSLELGRNFFISAYCIFEILSCYSTKMKIFSRIATILIILFILINSASAREWSSGLNVNPRMPLPLGEDSSAFKPGMGMEIEGLFSYSALPFLSFGLNTGYQFVPLQLQQSSYAGNTNLSLIDYGLIVKSGFSISDRFSLFARANAGAFNAILHGDTGGSAMGFAWGVNGGVDFILNKSLALQIGAGYSSYIPLYNGLSINIGLSIRIAGPGSLGIPRKDFVPAAEILQPVTGNIEFFDVRIEKIFPILYKYYFNRPVGSATVLNNGDETITDVEIRLSLSQHMDSPSLSGTIEELLPGEKASVELNLLLTGSVLSITEGAKLAGELTADYFRGKRPGNDSRTVVVETYHRNAMRWDDDEKIAAFITARDEEIQRYSRNIASLVRDLGIKGMNGEFQKGLTYLEVMNLAGIAYVIDPGNSYKEMSANAFAVDTVQFPRQTIEFRAGDCDDMTVTYTSLLEAVGVETGFITVPGHIYSAFKINMNKAEAARTFSTPEKFIYIDEEVWVPVETTALTEGFLKAWEMGADQWYRHAENNNSRLFPTRNAWSTYEPVAFEVSDHRLEQIDSDKLVERVTEELKSFVDDEIAVQEEGLRDRLERRPGNPRILNRMGVLYARYDRNDEAMDLFKEAAAAGTYLPAQVNIGNIAFLDEDYYTAGSWYQKVINAKPTLASAVLGMARVSHALNDFGKAESLYAELQTLSPELAERYTYLDNRAGGTSRASDAMLYGTSIAWDWDDSEEEEVTAE